MNALVLTGLATFWLSIRKLGISPPDCCSVSYTNLSPALPVRIEFNLLLSFLHNLPAIL